MLEFTKRIVPYLVAIMVFAFGWHLGSQSTDAKWKEEVQNEYVKKQTARAETQKAIDAVSAKYQADLEGLEGSTDRIIADLQSDNKRLRIRVKPTSGTTQSDGRCVIDGYAELDERDAKRLIAIGVKGDKWIKALQDTVRALQQDKEVTH